MALWPQGKTAVSLNLFKAVYGAQPGAPSNAPSDNPIPLPWNGQWGAPSLVLLHSCRGVKQWKHLALLSSHLAWWLEI